MENIKWFEEWFERFSVDLTGLKDNPMAAKKITLLIWLGFLYTTIGLYILIHDVQSLGDHFDYVVNDIREQTLFPVVFNVGSAK